MNKKCVLIMPLIILLQGFLDGTPRRVLIIRHAEKTESKEEVRFEAWHFAESNPLSYIGQQRAWAYVPFFTMNPVMTRYGKITHLFAAKPDKYYQSVRPVQTITPLSKYLSMPINVDFGIESKGDMQNPAEFNAARNSKGIKALRDHIMNGRQYQDGCVLIAYEHHNIPELLEFFGATKLPFKKWPHDVFDWVMVLEFDTKTGKLEKAVKIRERLMAGDSVGGLLSHVF